MQAWELQQWWIWVVLSVFVCEICRYINHRRLKNRLACGRTPLSPTFDAHVWSSFFIGRLLREASFSPLKTREFLSNIFWGIDFNQITHMDMKEMLLLFTACREACDAPPKTANDVSRVECLISDMERTIGHVFPHSNDGIDHPFIRINHPIMNHSPASPIFQPLPIAALRSVLRTATNMSLKHQGYSRFVCQLTGIVYWIPAMKRGQRCLLFIPGFGIGATAYMPMISALRKNLTNFIVIVENPGISGFGMRRSDGLYPCAEEIVESISTLVTVQLRRATVDVVCHSYGGIILSYIMNSKPEIIHRAVYMEVACFFSNTSFFWPEIFRTRPTQSPLVSMAKCMWMRMFFDYCLYDNYHQHVIHNAIWFFEYCNRESTLNNSTMVLLSSKDHLVDSTAVASYLQRYFPAVKLYLMKDWKHGTAVIQHATSVPLIVDFLITPDNALWQKVPSPASFQTTNKLQTPPVRL